jgi:abortive infection bacteriophage resistance protein
MNPEPFIMTESDLLQKLENFVLQNQEFTCIDASTVRGTRLRYPEANQAAPYLVPIEQSASRPYLQPYQSPHELIEKLRGRCLIIEDANYATEWLNKVGYYRLKGYGLHFRAKDAHGKFTEQYRVDTRFEALTDLYEWDRELRLLVLDAIERIEVAFRSRLNETMASRHGPHWLMNRSLFSDKCDSKSGKLIFDHAEFLSKAIEESRRNKESLSIGHYYRTYDAPPLPPCWMLGEVLSMGSWSKAYGMLKDRANQKPVADAFRASPPELISWIHALTNLRNTCAHHSRLWDRRFVTCPSKKGNLRHVIDANDRLFAQVATLLYCLWSIESESCWLEEFDHLLKRHPDLDFMPMGFPTDWRNRLERMREQNQ